MTGQSSSLSRFDVIPEARYNAKNLPFVSVLKKQKYLSPLL